MQNCLMNLTVSGWLFWLDSKTGGTLALKIISCIVLPCTILIIFNYFGAFLYKFLSAEPIPIQTLDDLIRSHLYLVADNSSQTVLNLVMVGEQKFYAGSINSMYATTYLQHPETFSWENGEGTAEIIANKKRIIKNPKLVRPDIVSGLGAFVTYPTTINVENANSWKNYDGKDLCDTGHRLSVLPFSSPFAAGMLMPKGSVYKDLFNIQLVIYKNLANFTTMLKKQSNEFLYLNRLLILMESGLMARYMKEFDSRPRCLNPNDILYGRNAPNFSTISLSIADLLTGFLILCTGMALCIVVYCCEVFKKISQKSIQYKSKSRLNT